MSLDGIGSWLVEGFGRGEDFWWSMKEFEWIVKIFFNLIGRLLPWGFLISALLLVLGTSCIQGKPVF